MEQRKLIAIPFEGFYNSQLDYELDSEAEQDRDYFELEGEDSDEIDVEYPEPNWKKIHIAVAEKYCEKYNSEFYTATGINLNIKFKELWSPKEYNFETDRIYAYADEGALNKVIAKIGLAKIRKELREAYAPRDGYMPFSSTLVSIEDKPKNFPDLFFKDVILELLFNSEMIYNDDSFLTDVRESYHQF